MFAPLSPCDALLETLGLFVAATLPDPHQDVSVVLASHPRVPLASYTLSTTPHAFIHAFSLDITLQDPPPTVLLVLPKMYVAKLTSLTPSPLSTLETSSHLFFLLPQTSTCSLAYLSILSSSNTLPILAPAPQDSAFPSLLLPHNIPLPSPLLFTFSSPPLDTITFTSNNHLLSLCRLTSIPHIDSSVKHLLIYINTQTLPITIDVLSTHLSKLAHFHPLLIYNTSSDFVIHDFQSSSTTIPRSADINDILLNQIISYHSPFSFLYISHTTYPDPSLFNTLFEHKAHVTCLLETPCFSRHNNIFNAFNISFIFTNTPLTPSLILNVVSSLPSFCFVSGTLSSGTLQNYQHSAHLPPLFENGYTILPLVLPISTPTLITIPLTNWSFNLVSQHLDISPLVVDFLKLSFSSLALHPPCFLPIIKHLHPEMTRFISPLVVEQSTSLLLSPTNLESAEERRARALEKRNASIQIIKQRSTNPSPQLSPKGTHVISPSTIPTTTPQRPAAIVTNPHADKGQQHHPPSLQRGRPPPRGRGGLASMKSMGLSSSAITIPKEQPKPSPEADPMPPLLKLTRGNSAEALKDIRSAAIANIRDANNNCRNDGKPIEFLPQAFVFGRLLHSALRQHAFRFSAQQYESLRRDMERAVSDEEFLRFFEEFVSVEQLNHFAERRFPPLVPTTDSWPHIIFSETAGTRMLMEDALSVVDDVYAFGNIPRQTPGDRMAFVGVYDGHLGPGASEFASWALPYCFVRSHLTNINTALRNAFIATDNALLGIAKKYGYRCGTTAVCCVITKTHIHCANVGDSEAYLARNTGSTIQLSYSHVATDTAEAARIVQNGGKIFNYQGTRVEGVMQVTRSLGDLKLKRFIIPEPYLMDVRLDGTEEFLLLASDGLFHFLTPHDAVDVVRRLLRNLPVDLLAENAIPYPPSREAIADCLVQLALKLNSSDNVSVIIVFF